MAKNTKKKLVTGLACAVPTVIAIPSLLTLTQCGAQTSTEHIKLSGDTKKDETKTVLETKYKYELLLENVKDPTTVQVSLPNVSINGKKISNDDKFGLYESRVSANGVVTIIFDRDAIISASKNTVSNDEYVPFTVKFDVNLKNDEFNETLANFTLDIKVPEFNFDTSSMKNSTLQSEQSKATYLTDYEGYIVPDQYYEFKGTNYKVLMYSEEHEEEVDLLTTNDFEGHEGTYAAVFDESTGKLSIHGWAIRNDIKLVFAPQPKTFKIDQTGCQYQGEYYFNFIGLPNVATYGQTIQAKLNWTKFGQMFNEEDTQILVDQEDIKGLPGVVFNDTNLEIPGEYITGPIKLVVKQWHVPQFSATLDNSDDVTFETASPVTYKNEYKAKFRITNEGEEITSSKVFVGGRKLEADEYTIDLGTKNDPAGFFGVVTIPAEKVVGNIYMQDFESDPIIHKVNLKYADATTKKAIKWDNVTQIPWGKDAKFNFLQFAQDEPTKMKRGYKFNSATATISRGTLVEPLTATPIYDVADNPESVTGILIPGTQLKETYSGTIDLTVKAEICSRSATIPHQASDKWNVTIDPTAPIDVEHDYSATFVPDAGYETDTLVVKRKKFNSTDYETLDPSLYSFTNNHLVIPAAQVVDNLLIEYTVKQHAYIVQPNTTKCTLSKYQTYDEQHAYVHSDYYCQITPDENYEFDLVNHFPEVSIEGKGKLTKDTDYEFTQGTGTSYVLHIKPTGKVLGNVTITCQAFATVRTVNWTGITDKAVLSNETKNPTCETGYKAHLAAKIEEQETESFYEITGKPVITIGGNSIELTSKEWVIAEDQKSADLNLGPSRITGAIEINYVPAAIKRGYKFLEAQGGEATTYEASGNLDPSFDKDATITITAKDHYELTAGNKPRVFIANHGEVPTAQLGWVQQGTSYVLTVPKSYIRGNITVNFTPNAVQYQVTQSLTNCSCTSGQAQQFNATYDDEITLTYQSTGTLPNSIYVDVNGSHLIPGDDTYTWTPNGTTGTLVIHKHAITGATNIIITVA